VCIIDEGRGVDLGGGVEGAWRGFAGDGDAARYMSRSAPSFCRAAASKGLLRTRADLA